MSDGPEDLLKKDKEECGAPYSGRVDADAGVTGGGIERLARSTLLFVVST